MAEIIELKPRRLNDIETCRKLYEEMKADPASVVFAPCFADHARKVHGGDDDLPEAC